MTARAIAVFPALLGLWAASLIGQDSAAARPRARGGAAPKRTAEAIREAQQHYERLELERAIPILRNLVSPSWGADMTIPQRVESYKYLGAALVLVRDRDAAVASFQSALQLDPFTDLDPAKYTPAQVEAFAAARRATFVIGVRPVAAQRVDPRTQRVVFSVAATQATAIDIHVQRIAGNGDSTSADTVAASVFQGTIEGLREIFWDGLVSGGRIASPGRYLLLVGGTSRVLSRSDTQRVYFDLRRETEALEDTLPDLTGLLPESTQPHKGTGELLKGVAVGSVALAIAGPLSSSALGENKTGAAVVTGVALVTGIAAFIAARHQQPLSENIAKNAQRRAQRDTENIAIRQRNAARIAATALVVTPAAGVGQ